MYGRRTETTEGPIDTLERIRAGDEEALEETLRREWSPLVRFLAGRLGSAEHAQDAAQETFVRLWEKRERWEGGSVRALVYRIAINVAHDLRRKARARERADELHVVAAVPGPEEQLASSRTEARLAAAFESLPPQRREVFDLVRLHGLTYREAAEALGLAPQTIANHMSLALRDLRRELADLLEPHGSVEVDARSHDG